MKNDLFITKEKAAWLDALTNRRIKEIRNAPSKSFTPSEGALSFFVSPEGNDDNDGRTPDTAWKTLDRVNRANDSELHSGDVVYFRRGGLWRGKLQCFTGGVSYTAYGEGEKPKIYSGPQDYSGDGKWKPTDIADVYECCDLFERMNDIGFITINRGKLYGVKKTLSFDEKKGCLTDAKTGERFEGYRDLKEDLTFFHDWRTKKLYFCSTEGDPGKRFYSIELSLRQHAIAMWGDNINVDSFTVRYVGGHGVAAGTMTGLHVTNCEFGWIGGSVMAPSYSEDGIPYSGRYGNGVEIYGGCDDFEVENNLFYQIYDAGISHQCTVSKPDESIIMKNIRFRNNVILNAYYSIEYFLYVSYKNNPSHIENALYEGNICRFSAHGFTNQRPDVCGGTHIKTGRAENPAVNFVIKDNIFDEGRVWILAVRTKPTDIPYPESLPVPEHNIYIQSEDGQFGFFHDEALRLSAAGISGTSWGEKEINYILSLDKSGEAYIRPEGRNYTELTDDMIESDEPIRLE